MIPIWPFLNGMFIGCGIVLLSMAISRFILAMIQKRNLEKKIADAKAESEVAAFRDEQDQGNCSAPIRLRTTQFSSYEPSGFNPQCTTFRRWDQMTEKERQEYRDYCAPFDVAHGYSTKEPPPNHDKQ